MSARLRRATAPLVLAAARFHHRPGRWLAPAAGIAIVTAFACAVAGEGTVAGDRAARRSLAAVSALQGTVKVTAQGPGADAEPRIRTVLAAPGLGPLTKVTLLNPLRLRGTVVQIAAIEPLTRWVDAPAAPPPTSCRPTDCPLLHAVGSPPVGALALSGAALRLTGEARLRSPVPLGFVPHGSAAYAAGESPAPPLLLSGDTAGLERLGALGAAYRTTSWLAALDVSTLHTWDLAGVQRRLARDQAELLAADPSLTVSVPVDALQTARTQAAAAPRRLLLAGGGAAAVMVAFVLLAGGALRGDLAQELARLRAAGATRGQRALLVGAEAAGVSALGVLSGVLAGTAAVMALAGAEGEPLGGVLAHGLGTPAAAGLVVVGWLSVTLLLAGSVLAGGIGRGQGPLTVADVLALAAVAALALAMGRGTSTSASDPLPVLIAPLCCLAAGVLVFRLAGAVLRAGERVARPAALPLRLALLNLARAPAPGAAAAAFLTVSVSLAGFALSYRATVMRSVADQAANQVPLDVTVSAGPSFAAPVLVAPLRRWRQIAGGPVLPVNRTEASFPSGATTAAVPLVALPAQGLGLLHGWRDGDASAPRSSLARRLIMPGPARTAGPTLPPGTRTLAVRAAAHGVGVGVEAILRDGEGNVSTAPLGYLSGASRVLRAALAPSGAIELEALGLVEPTGLLATAGHQNAENAGAQTPTTATVRIVSVTALDGRGGALARLNIARWRARGAASGARPVGAGLTVGFSANGQGAVLRPIQPGDSIPLAVLTDAQTASQAGPGGRLALTVAGVAMPARVVGRLKRFPTVDAGAGGFVVADQTALAARLEADAPGSGRADELWLSAPRPAATRRALASPQLSALSVAYRADIERRLRADPVLGGVIATLVIAALVAVLLAGFGLLVTLTGGARDRALEHDLAAQGLGPRSLRLDLRLRLLLTGALGVLGGVLAGVVLTRLAVAAVQASAIQAPPSPPLIAVIPWAQTTLLALVIGVGLGALTWVATRRPVGVAR